MPDYAPTSRRIGPVRDLTAEATAARNLLARARRAYLSSLGSTSQLRRSDAKANLHACTALLNRVRLGLLVCAVALVAAGSGPVSASEPKPAKLSTVCPNGTVGKSYTELPAPAGSRRAVLVCIVPATHPVNTYHYKVRQEGSHCYGTVEICEGGDCWIEPVSFVCP